MKKPEEFDTLIRNAMFAADNAAIQASLTRSTPAGRTRAAVEAALTQLIQSGQVIVVPREEWPDWMVMNVRPWTEE